MADTRTLMLRLDAETEAARAKLGALGATTDTVAQRYAKLVKEARDLDIQQDILNHTTDATAKQYTELSARLRRSAEGFKEITAEARAAGVAVDNAGDKASRSGKQLSGASTKGSLLAGAAGGIAAGIGGAGLDFLQDAARDAVEYATSLNDLSKQLGVSTDFLQDFRFGAKQTGATVEQADLALARFVQTTGKAASGNKTAAAAFKGLGVDIADANGNLKPTEVLYGEVADALARLPDPARQASEAQKLFGFSSVQLLPLLKSGSEGLSTFGDAADALGLKLSAIDIQRIDDLASKGAAVKEVLTSQMAAAIGQNADSIIALANAAGAALGRLSALLQSFRGVQELVAREGAGTLFTSSFERQIDFSTVEGRAKRLTKEANDAKAALAAAEKARDTGGVIGELFQGGSAPNIAQLKNKARQAAARATAARLELSATTFVDTLGSDTTAPGSGGAVIAPKDAAAEARAKAAARKAAAEAKKKAEAAAKSRKILDSAPGLTGFDIAEGLVDGEKEARANDAKVATAEAARLKELFSFEVNPQVADGMKLIAAEADRAAEAATRFKDDLSFGLADAIISGRSIGDVLVDSFKRAGIQALASGIFNLLGGGGASGFGGGILSSFKSILGFADGGDPPIGRVSIVGERGPELFVPKVAGSIVPGEFRFGGGGGTNVTVQVSQALHFDVGLEAVDQRIAGAAPVLLQAAQRGTLEALRNSGIGRV